MATDRHDEIAPLETGGRADRVQQALYRIAEASSAAADMDAFYRSLHETVGGLMDARNFYVALYDADRTRKDEVRKRVETREF